MSRKLSEGAQVEAASAKAFPGCANYTPYLVVHRHRDGTVDLALRDTKPDRVIARRVHPKHLSRID